MKKNIKPLLLLFFISFMQTVSAQRGGWIQYQNPGLVYDMLQDSAGNFHLATATGYVKLGADLEVLEHVTLFNNNTLNTNVFKAVAMNPVTGKVVLCTDKNEILEKDGATFTPIIYNPASPFNEITRIWISNNGDIILKGAWNDTGIQLYSKGSWDTLALNYVNDFLEDHNGLWHFATPYDGIKTYNNTTQNWVELPNSPIDSTMWVSDLLLDNSTNSIFIATNSSGVYEYKTDSSSIKYEEFNLSGISQIFKENDTLHVSHRGLGYSRCVLPSNTWTNYNPNNSNLPNNWLTGAFPVNGGVLLQPSGSPFRFLPNSDSVTSLNLNKEDIGFNNFQKMQVRKVGDNMQFFGTSWQGGLEFKDGPGAFQNFTSENSILTSSEFNDIDIDANGTIWLSTKDGLYSIDTANNWVRYDSSNSHGLLRGNNVTNFAVGQTDDDHPIFAASTSGASGIVAALDFPGAATSTKTIDSTDNPHFSNKVTSFGIGGNTILVGTEIGTVIPVHVSKQFSLPLDFGYHFQAMPDSGEVREINNFVFGAGINTEYHFSNFFSVHTAVGFVFALIESPGEANGIIPQPTDTSALNKSIQGFEQIAFGNAGYTYWFKSGVSQSYLFGYDKDASEPLRYVDVNNLNNTGSIQITDLNLTPSIYSIIAMPNSDNKMSIYLNTSMGLLVKSDFEFDKTTDLSFLSTGDETGLNAFPNPATDIISISLNEDIQGNYKVEIRDLSGKLLIEENNKTSINIGQLASGAYLITLIDSDESNTVLFYKK